MLRRILHHYGELSIEKTEREEKVELFWSYIDGMTSMGTYLMDEVDHHQRRCIPISSSAKIIVTYHILDEALLCPLRWKTRRTTAKTQNTIRACRGLFWRSSLVICYYAHLSEKTFLNMTHTDHLYLFLCPSRPVMSSHLKRFSIFFSYIPITRKVHQALLKYVVTFSG